ncbi:recombinase family protein [Streptomyces niveus]|uniref:recombinase family protein n=1 Tax=Streptomyces niveus TaxID=193462 RepID=UPI00341B65B5
MTPEHDALACAGVDEGVALARATSRGVIPAPGLPQSGEPACRPDTRVVLYACHELGDPVATLRLLRTRAMDRGWVVHAELYDLCPLAARSTQRPQWQLVMKLLTQGDAQAVLVLKEAQIELERRHQLEVRRRLEVVGATAHFLLEPRRSRREVLRRGGG